MNRQLVRTVDIWARILTSRLGDEEIPALVEMIQRDPVGLIAALCGTASARTPDDDASPLDDPHFVRGFHAGYETVKERSNQEYRRGFDYGQDTILDEFRDLLDDEPDMPAMSAYKELENGLDARRRR